MADIDHHLLESPAAATTAATTTTTSVDDNDDGEGFTFSAVSPLAAVGESFAADGRIGPVYPVFGRPRSPPLLDHGEEEEQDPASSATVRVPLGQLLLEERDERGSSPGQSPDDDGGELGGVPAENYCLWSPGASPAASGGYHQSPRSRCEKSGSSTGSVLRWRQRLLGRSNSDGKDKFVYILNTISSDERNAKEGDGKGGRRSSSFLPCNKRDLVGLFANAAAFRRSYHPF